MKRLFAFFILIFTALLWAESADSEYMVQFSGFIKTDIILDSRQTVSAREGHFLLYPAGELPDTNGLDINTGSNLNILAIQTRLKVTITGPDAFGAKMGGLIEAEFFGQSNSDVNGLRLRHAFLKLNWVSTELLVGQFWHPMFVTDVFPGTVSFNTGAIFQPFSRNPQIRLAQTTGNLKLIVAALSQRDFTSTGPEGASSVYLRNAAIPNLHGQLQLKSKKRVFGISGDWKRLRPMLSFNNYETRKYVNSSSVMGYARLNLSAFTLKMEGVLGQNMTDHLMLGGYGIQSQDSSTGEMSYIPTSVMSVWTDIACGNKLAGGCFIGYTKNLGANDDKNGEFYGRGSNIDMIFRISPRVMWNSGNTRLSTELEYTAAAYGTPDNQGKVTDTSLIANTRLLVAIYYFF
ncbi:MAG: DcaP family trimeric outer membrane transporter [Candidatus Marinimicrobia bacterium]|nr:DcaP family trimeric outer membrane transporter [Candidatus Neomarinimicrobiota bacterium]